jgi:uncharacterized damage-inducible protein DinB
MNASEVLDKSHLMVIEVLDDLPHEDWDVPGVCGNWSVKDVIAHLTSYEKVVVDVLNTFLGGKPTQSILKCFNDYAAFNEAEVEARKYLTAQQVEQQYNEMQLQSAKLLAQIPEETVQKRGTMPWAGAAECLADYISSVYEHTCEHCDQIAHFRNRVK